MPFLVGSVRDLRIYKMAQLMNMLLDVDLLGSTLSYRSDRQRIKGKYLSEAVLALLFTDCRSA